MAKNKRRMVECQNCASCCPIGEGDHICSAAESEEDSLIIEDYMPTESYCWCNGSKYEEM